MEQFLVIYINRRLSEQMKTSNSELLLQNSKKGLLNKKGPIFLNDLMKQMTLMNQLIKADRMENWKLHLDTVQRMLPYFHASVNSLHAKSADMYLQNKLN